MLVCIHPSFLACQWVGQPGPDLPAPSVSSYTQQWKQRPSNCVPKCPLPGLFLAQGLEHARKYRDGATSVSAFFSRYYNLVYLSSPPVPALTCRCQSGPPIARCYGQTRPSLCHVLSLIHANVFCGLANSSLLSAPSRIANGCCSHVCKSLLVCIQFSSHQ